MIKLSKFTNSPNNKIKICIYCGTPVMINGKILDNIFPKNINSCTYECKNCYREYYLQNQCKGHTTLKGHKRPHPLDNKCEICQRSITLTNKQLRLTYHHWNDKDISKGIWSCCNCHQMMEQVDKRLHIKYLKLRKQIGE